jgi:peptide-methionine (R)-S-oxide reductase
MTLQDLDMESPMEIDRRQFIGTGALAVSAVALLGWGAFANAAAGKFEVTLPDAEWKKRLSPDAYQVLRHEGTETPGTSPLLAEHRPGIFTCGGCKLPVFSSKTKFESGTGWPSFWAPLPKAVATSSDGSLGMSRTEVHCRRCGGHLGHVFNDGPKPTGLRYCMNGVAMGFVPGKA